MYVWGQVKYRGNIGNILHKAFYITTWLKLVYGLIMGKDYGEKTI